MIYCMSRLSLKSNCCSVCGNNFLKHSCRNSADRGPVMDKPYSKDFETLGLKMTADQESVRKAFIALCKRFHPDSGSPDANAEKFQKIEKAYRSLQTKFSHERWDVTTTTSPDLLKDVEEFDIKHTAPQHRQYLSWDGVGSGTPSQRQHQHSQRRAAQAAQRVLEHKIGGIQHTGNALTLKDQQRIEKTKTRFGMDRLVEDLIQESMARGEFDNLKGTGKPLQRQTYNNPHVDFVTHKMNEIMIDNGFTPEWITIKREIEQDINDLRQNISRNLHYNGGQQGKNWNEVKKEWEKSAQLLNKKIQLFNLIVPILNRQMLLFRIDEEINQLMAYMVAKEKNIKLSNRKESQKINDDDNFVINAIASLFKWS